MRAIGKGKKLPNAGAKPVVAPSRKLVTGKAKIGPLQALPKSAPPTARINQGGIPNTPMNLGNAMDRGVRKALKLPRM